MARPSKRAEILDAGVLALHARGFAQTSVDAIALSAGVPKGSFFGHFGSKEAFAVEALNLYFARWLEVADAIAADTALSPAAKVKAMIQAAADGDGSDAYRGCLIGNLSVELAAHSESVRSCLTDIFREWEKPFARVITAAQDDGEWINQGPPPQLARHIVNALQGALLRSKVDQSKEAIEDFYALVFGLLLPG
jgi:TetR/AcrR family transcriptional repressor of nem operon